MRATVSATVSMGGETASTSQTRTEDGFVGTTPEAPKAHAGVLTTRSTSSTGVITTTDTELITGDKAVLTWEDDDGNLKHRYDVDCDNVTAFVITFSGGAGDDLPDEDSVINVALQVLANITFDFDDIELLVVTTNVRGVVAFLDGTDVEKLVMDMAASKMGYWDRESGFPEPMTGTPVTHVLVGSGSTAATPAFLPKILGLYDATDPYGSGQ